MSRDERLGPQLDMLRAITREMATAENVDTVLQSITTALVERTHVALARIFLYLDDRECPICRDRIEAGLETPTGERALHLVAAAGIASEIGGLLHRIPLDSPFPVAEMARTRTPMLIDDWRRVERLASNTLGAQLWLQHGIVGMASYPLELRGELLGAMGCLARRPFHRLEFELLGIFADQAAMAIKNAYLFRERAQYKERLQLENMYLQDEIRREQGFAHIVGDSPQLRAVLRKIVQVAGVDTTVLLTGETGTGKELVARAIHDASARSDGPMIRVNCGALPQGVVESELFGHEKGAFSGALQRRIGRFELADGGTLFMDEVGDLALDTQVKLLRSLQEREIERVGGTRPIKVDARLIAATNRDLESDVTNGRFRADLYYRLNVFPIRLPTLRERPSDIPLLVEHILAQLQRKLAKPLRCVTPSSLDRLQHYSWPGNIRELQNVLERACVLARGPEVEIVDALRPSLAKTHALPADARIATLAEHERLQIRRALAAVNGRVHGPRGAAALLGVNPSTLRSRMQKLGIGKPVS